jgi:hypothetical protein
MFWHKERYTTTLDDIALKEKLDALVDIQASNTFMTHRRGNYGGDDLVQGHVKENQAVFWRTNRKWNGIFYPIFSIVLEDNDNAILLKTRFNPAAEIIVLVLGVGMILVLMNFVFGFGLDFPQILFRLGAAAIIFLIFMGLPIYNYYSLKAQTTREVERILGLVK